jgi:hypothetical protein
MRDSVTSGEIPIGGTELAAGYVNGYYVWSAADWARFPNIPHVTIDVNGTRTTADVLDVENGDATPAGAVRWILAKRALNGTYPPVCYVNQGNMGEVEALAQNAGLALGSDYLFWVATLDGRQTIGNMNGVIAVQYAGSSQTGANYDQSIVYDDNFKNPGHAIMTLTAVDLAAIKEVVREDRDWIAGAVLYALGYLDPNTPLPTGAQPAGLLASSAAHVREILANTVREIKTGDTV